MAQLKKLQIPAAGDPMVVKTYRVADKDANDAEIAAKQLYKQSLSVVVREFVKKLAKQKK
jgi:hypothetical protein